jgi:hypothetical protein
MGRCAVDRDEFLDRYAATWRAADPDKFPFVRGIADEFAGHDDREQSWQHWT